MILIDHKLYTIQATVNMVAESRVGDQTSKNNCLDVIVLRLSSFNQSKCQPSPTKRLSRYFRSISKVLTRLGHAFAAFSRCVTLRTSVGGCFLLTWVFLLTAQYMCGSRDKCMTTEMAKREID